MPLPVSAYLGNFAASQSFAHVAIQCPRVAYPSKADPICALANLGLPILCHSRLCDASAIHCPSIPWRFRRSPILVAHCLSVARAKQGDALPPQFSSVHLVRIASHRGHPLRCLCLAKLFAAAAMPGNAFPSQIQPFLCRSDSWRFLAVALRRIAVLCHSRAQIRGSQLCPFTSPRINGNRRLSRALPG